MARKTIYPASVQPGIPKLGKLPVGWQEITFGDVLDVVERPMAMQDSVEYQLVTAKRNRGGIVPREILKGKDVLTKTQFYVRTGDFLISKRQIIHGACGIVPPQLDGAIVSNEYATLRPKEGLLLDFLQHLTHTIFFQQTCFHASVGVDVEKMIFDLPDWLKYKVHIPYQEEQRKIADILSTWDRTIDLTTQLIATQEQRKRGLMQELLTGKRRFAEFAGEERCTRLLREVAEIRYGKSSEGIREENGQYKIFGTGGVSGRTNTPIYDQSAVILGRKGTIDRPQLSLEPFWTIDTTFYCVPHNDTDVHWLYYKLGSLALEQLNESTGIPSLSRENLYTIAINLPPLAEQRRIAEVLQACDAEISLLEQKRDLLEQQKQGLMQQLLTGRVRVNVGQVEA